MGYALRGPILWASSKPAIKRVITALPPTRALVRRFVAGEHLKDAVRVAVQLREAGILASIDHLGEHVTTERQARDNVLEAQRLVIALQQAGVAAGSEISLKLSALGQELDDALATRSALEIALSARDAGVLLTVDMEDHTTTDRTLATLHRVREQVPSAGVAVQAMLRRTPRDLSRLAATGCRVRLVKGAYDEPEGVAVRRDQQITEAYRSGLEQLFRGGCYPMAATHDPALISHALSLALRHGRGIDGFELQMLYGVRPAEQRRLASLGHCVRAYVPYGADWYGYLTRRLAEKPANLLLLTRSLRPEAARRTRTADGTQAPTADEAPRVTSAEDRPARFRRPPHE